MTENIVIGDATLYLGDCADVLKALPDNSVDSIVTDPPYHLVANKKDDPLRASPDAKQRNAGFMGMTWDGGDIAQNVEMWSECLRVLKPGGHLLAFSGTRTQHRMVCAIEDAGFEIRDQIMWIYGSGFPKSLDVSKAITNRADPQKVAEIKQWLAAQFERSGKSKAEINRACGFMASDYLKTEPSNDAGGRATWHLLLPYGEKWQKLKEVVGFSDEHDAEIEKYGVVASRRSNPKENREIYGKYSGTITEYHLTDAACQWSGWGTALKPAHEPICVARKPLIGTVAGNVLAYGTGALNIDACRIQTDESLRIGAGKTWDKMHEGEGRSRTGEHSADLTYQDKGGTNFAMKPGPRGGDPDGRWPANVIHDGSDEVISLFPANAGAFAPVMGNEPSSSTKSVFGQIDRQASNAFHDDTGSAARFFYCAKAGRKDRNEGCDAFDKKPLNWSSGTKNPGSFQAEGTDKTSQNNHPTVKPTALMAYLCRLVTPPGGIILDPFMGSGSTGKACALEGFKFIGIDMTPEYVAIAKARIEFAQRIHVQERMFA